MLCELKVENLALIESLHLQFDSENSAGLVVMTGETGAGKSIMLRAIQMLTGGRAQSDWVRSGADQCQVEALFEVNGEHSHFLNKLSEAGFGEETVVVIKRIITEKGRSRLYVNGSLATARVVRELTDYLLNMASQHDHQQLLQPQLHLDFIDTMGEHWPTRMQLGEIHREWQEKKGRLAELRKQEQDKEQKRDFLTFQLEEIRQAAPVEGEDEVLAAERQRLKSADTLIRLSGESFGALSGTISDHLSVVRKNMEQIAQLDSGAEQLAEIMREYAFQAEDLIDQLREYRDSLENDPYRLEQVTERIDVIQALKRKYGETIGKVLEFCDNAARELKQLDNLEIQLEDLENEVATLEAELITIADSLSLARKKTAANLEEAMASELVSLAFAQASLLVKWQDVDETIASIQASGRDRVEFFFSANPGEPARPLAKVASGGELSRLMLALKCLLARKDMVETVIFDEVDAGIGGEAAEAVARKIQELSGHHQVFCITHLPQIAARGNDHYLVKKSVNGGRTLSSISSLSPAERENEIARMLAGDSVTEETHAWARELLSKNR